MTDLTPEEKLEDEFNDKFQAAIINDERIRKLFIDAMTGATTASDVDMESVHKFITAVDYMIGALGYGIFDMFAEGGPVHISEKPD